MPLATALVVDWAGIEPATDVCLGGSARSHQRPAQNHRSAVRQGGAFSLGTTLVAFADAGGLVSAISSSSRALGFVPLPSGFTILGKSGSESFLPAVAFTSAHAEEFETLI